MVEKITTANFDELVKNASLPVLVDFYADWCGPCKMMTPAVTAASEKYAGKLVVGKLNVDDNMDLAMEYKVASIPYIALFKDGVIVDSILGFVPEAQLQGMIEKHL